MCSDFADATLQPGHACVWNPQRRIPQVVIRFPQHTIYMLRRSLNDKVTTIASLAWVRSKNDTGCGFSAVAYQFANGNTQALQNVRH